MIRRRYFLPLIVLFGAAALGAVAEPAADELEQPRRRLAELRKHPEQLKRVRENLQIYLQLPIERGKAVAKLDRDLHGEPAQEQARLWNALERYADWLEELRQRDQQAYQAIKNAADSATRLMLIKDRRDREWMETQPKEYRDQWEKRQGEARVKYVADLRQQERHKHEQWRIAKRFWRELEIKQPMPSRLSDFSGKVKKYVDEYLMPFLTLEEKTRLTEAEGNWPDYPQLLVEIASQHPSALPPSRKETLPVHVNQLPAPVRQRVEDKKGGPGKNKLIQKLAQFDGRPNFATKVVEFGTKDGKVPFEHEFWACNYNSLQPPMKVFVDKTLIPALTDSADMKKLSDNEGRWPYYPQTIQELSQKHNLSPPWHILPEPDRWKWDLYRNSKGRSWGAEIVKEKKNP